MFFLKDHDRYWVWSPSCTGSNSLCHSKAAQNLSNARSDKCSYESLHWALYSLVWGASKQWVSPHLRSSLICQNKEDNVQLFSPCVTPAPRQKNLRIPSYLIWMATSNRVYRNLPLFIRNSPKDGRFLNRPFNGFFNFWHVQVIENPSTPLVRAP